MMQSKLTVLPKNSTNQSKSNQNSTNQSKSNQSKSNHTHCSTNAHAPANVADTKQAAHPASPSETMTNAVYDALETLDQLHTAASDGGATATGMTPQELIALLRDVIYTAQETIDELSDQMRSKQQARQPQLRIVEKMERIG